MSKSIIFVLFLALCFFSSCKNCQKCWVEETDPNGNSSTLVEREYCGDALAIVEASGADCD